jgi:hypothetical protein
VATNDSDTPQPAESKRTAQPTDAVPSGASPTPPAATAPPRHRHGGWRWTGAVVLLLVAALLATLSVVARYARDEIINTDEYVATVTPLASDPAVQNAIAARVSTAVIEKIDIPNLINQLAQATGRPNADVIASAIAGPVNNAVQDFVNKTVLKFVQSSRFQKLWVNANTKAHTQLSGVLTGQGTDVVKTQGDQIIVEVGPIVDQVKQDLVNSGFSVASKIPSVSVQVPVITVQNLPRIQSYVNLLDKLATWLPLIALVLLALGIWLAPQHRRGALIGVMMIAALMIIMLVLLHVLRDAYTTKVADKGLNVPAALALYDTLLRFLIQAVEAVLVVSIVAAVWLYLAGPSWIGRFIRRWGQRGEDWIAHGINRTTLRFGPVPRFTNRYGTWFVIAAGVLAAFGLLLSPTIASAVWLSIGVLFVMLVVGVLARLRQTSTPQAPAA